MSARLLFFLWRLEQWSCLGDEISLPGQKSDSLLQAGHRGTAEDQPNTWSTGSHPESEYQKIYF